jgi:hypothetical protein
MRALPHGGRSEGTCRDREVAYPPSGRGQGEGFLKLEGQSRLQNFALPSLHQHPLGRKSYGTVVAEAAGLTISLMRFGI